MTDPKPKLTSNANQRKLLMSQVAHDMNNGLEFVRFGLGHLNSKLELLDDRRLIERMGYNLDFCQLALRNLLAFAGGEAFQPKRIAFAKVVEELRSILEPKLGDIEWRLDIDPNVQEILADEEQIKLALMNLIRSVIKVMPDGGVLALRANREHNGIWVEIGSQRNQRSFQDQTRDADNQQASSTSNSDLEVEIAHRIIQRHEGSMMLRGNSSENVAFVLRLPTNLKK